MSIHRGGPPGAVAAVSYNSMASLSPTRRFSSSTTGTTTSSGISSGTTTTKFNTCRSSKALDHTNYSSPTSTSYLSGSRKNHYSPARSVSSYSEGGSVSLAASKLPPKFSSTSTSSASSTTSSASSASNNRERFSLPASSNLSLSDGEFRSKYSPDNYVPSIYRNNSNSSLSSNSSTLNGHCKSFPLSSSTSGLAELHGGDERDSIGYREHRDRSYSNEISSSLVGGDRWSSTSNRHIKRRNNPLNTVLTGSDEIDSAPAATEQQQQQQQQSHHHQVIKRDTNNCDNDADDGFDEISLDPSDTENNLLDKNLSNIASTDSVIENLKDNDSEVDSIMIQSWKGHTGGNPSSIVDDTKVTSRPAGTHNDDSGKASTSRSLFDWDDSPSDAASRFNPSSSSSTSSTAANNTSNSPVGVHQAISRGVNEQIEESSSSRPPRSSRIPTRRDENYGLNGLRNIGNTCFMNSVIQCLSNTKPLLEYLLNEQYLNDINQSTSSMKGALIKVFAQVINELWESSGDHVVNTSSLKHQIQRFAPRFMGYAQQDAQEFLRYLLEGLHEDVNRVAVKPQPILTDIPDNFTDSQKAAESWKRYLRSEDSTIVDVFVGQLRSSLQCTSCDHISVTLDPFWDLSLPIPARSGTVKLNQCLEHFTKTEIMDGDEKPTCSKCQMRRKCTKRFSIQKFPKILVIHLKRFSPTERFRAKLSVLVDFPLTGLDLSAFAATGVQGCTYNLYGVANHSGTPYSGHYTAYCKHPYSGEWHEYNDSRVSSVSASSVISSEAYVLFYEQQTQSQQQQSSQSSQQQQQPLSHHL
ncbi:ubiquitin carboxyl-terminal hydrolase 2 isoform X2 [Microplitis demolitor]|uniref:ubiquitin carboxyl-terminal hydrolase 2 isoform X2 n=1 Tax=Microplitis demolitor TaxID=69319 RepID=UPI0004CD3F56|nr:ubiquitin carboxyl-terminal hydrolase 2 isoform X2 [Microplitis demolitor]